MTTVIPHIDYHSSHNRLNSVIERIGDSCIKSSATERLLSYNTVKRVALGTFIISIMGLIMPSLSYFAIFAALSLTTVLCKTSSNEITRAMLHREQLTIDAEVQKLLDPTEFPSDIAGEYTPVWIAKRPDINKPVVYEKLRKGIVRRVMYHWESGKFKDLTTRSRRNSAKNIEIMQINEAASIMQSFSQRIDRYIGRLHENNLTVYRPCILVTTDYEETSWPTNERDLNDLIVERILYALAFWTGVDLQLRHIQHPKVRLQLSGLIIGQHKEATPYVYDNEHLTGVNMQKAFESMVNYWREPAKNKVNFPTSGYDIVATMTDSKDGWRLPSRLHSLGDPGGSKCIKDSNLGIMLFRDNLAFSGIQLAVRETATVLGPKHNVTVPKCDDESHDVLASGANPGRNWSKCSLNQISKALQEKGHCFGRNFIEAPGKAIKRFLPGKMLNATARCKAQEWKDGHICPKKSTCAEAFCANNHIFSRCTSIGPALDGTACNEGKMCLDGKCVNNSTIF